MTDYVQMSHEPNGERGGVKAYQFLTVGLVYAILHCLINEFGVGRVCSEGGGEDGEAL